MYTFKTEEMRVPAKVWASEGSVETGCIEQVEHMASLPFAFHHVVLNADGHTGYGMPVGGVLATKGYVIPNAVGVDIGCGVRAVRTSVTAAQLAEAHDGEGTNLQAVIGSIMRNVPVGFPPAGVHKEAQNIEGIEKGSAYRHLVEVWPGVFPAPLDRAWGRADTQIGTLGGGNHFLEVQADEDDCVWLMLHSGSRALGKAVCDYFNAKAVALNERYFSEVPKAWELAFIPRDDELGQEYLAWMDLCLVYAADNRRRMMDLMVFALGATGTVTAEEDIDIHHNYAAVETHFGENVIVHRKGACLSPEGASVLIPGSMETASYIGRGLGSVDSFQSCSHGAGRRMSRGAARKARTVRDMVDSLKEKGIKLGTRSIDSVLDEAGHAYHDIGEVMENQRDLVTPVDKLRPLGVVKG